MSFLLGQTKLTVIYQGAHILYFPIAHNTLCLPPKFCINYCFQILLVGLHISKTIVHAKFGGQTKCIMGNWKIDN